MAIRDLTSQRLFIDAGLSAGAEIVCDPGQTNYLVNVLRMKAGGKLLVFNGREGEWRAVIAEAGKRRCVLGIEECVRAQEGGPDLHFVFSVLKRTKIEFVAQKATELGVSLIQPVVSEHAQVHRINDERMAANVIEAAEQCGILRVPRVEPLKALEDVLAQWPDGRALVFCDEAAPIADPITALGEIPAGPVGVLIGPEGGFSQRERARISAMAQARAISLGPRIMRADTAAIAALALVNAVLGDWRG